MTPVQPINQLESRRWGVHRSGVLQRLIVSAFWGLPVAKHLCIRRCLDGLLIFCCPGVPAVLEGALLGDLPVSSPVRDTQGDRLTGTLV